MTPKPIGRRCLRYAGKFPAKSAVAAPSKTPTYPRRLPMLPATPQTVQATSDHGELMTLACKTALVERDVAHLVLPDEVQVLAAADNARVGSPKGRTGDREIAPPAQSLRAAIEAISAADRPLVIIGNGARAGIDDIVALAEAIDAPVATTFKAKGLISDQHRLAAGVLGRSGTPVASWFMNEADMIVAFGVSFANHTGIADYKPIVQVDFDPMALGRFSSSDSSGAGPRRGCCPGAIRGTRWTWR